MKLEESVENIREKITNAFNKNLSKMGLSPDKQLSIDELDPKLRFERKRMADILNNLQGETGNYSSARDKLLEELSFTLFNRFAGIKVIEANQLQPEVITCRASHAGRSFGHKIWLEQNPDKGSLPLEGLREYIRYAFNQLSDKIQLYSINYLYDLLPEVYDLKEIINEFNKIDEKNWQSDDIMGWLYESYNRKKRELFKNSKKKIEYNWVSITSQIYTPRWVVEFILNNSLGKLWMEMHPESKLKENHDIANIPNKPIVKTKPVIELKVIDPAVGSGNFLLYAFDLFYEMYEEGEYAKEDIPRLIIENNLYGIDLDDRAVQIAQLGLYIKALKRNKNVKISNMNIVSSDFYLPEYADVKSIFHELIQSSDTVNLLEEIWEDLRMAYKFGSLIRIEEKIEYITNKLKSPGQEILWGNALTFWDEWKGKVFIKIREALQKYSKNNNGNAKFFKTKTQDSMLFAEIISNKYDIAVANPPYTDSGNYGKELKIFIEKNYKKPFSFYSNLYAVFLKRCSEFIDKNGKIGMIHPLTFMYIKSYEDMRKYILNNFHINLLVELGIGGVFQMPINVDVTMYILEKNNFKDDSFFMDLQPYKNQINKKNIFFNSYKDYLNNRRNKHNFTLQQDDFRMIESYPFIYWISDNLREKFKENILDNIANVVSGIKTGNNDKLLRFWWEIKKENISIEYKKYNGKWIFYAKGGPYNKWWGNLWLCINWYNDGQEIRKTKNFNIVPKKFSFLEGITYSASGSKGINFRYLPSFSLYDMGGSSIFPNFDLYYSLAFLNSKLNCYIINCLNPTVNKQTNDLKRIPFVSPLEEIENKISLLSEDNVRIKKHLCEFSIIEMNYKHNPILWANERYKISDLKKLIKAYLDYENELLTRIYLSEALIDELIFQVYQVIEEDRRMILEKESIPVGNLPLFEDHQFPSDQILPEVKEYIKTIKIKVIDSEEKERIKKTILNLYRQSTSLEEICSKVQINPYSVIQIIKESSSLPEKRAQEIIQDLLFDVVREILGEDQDGIMPLVKYSGEDTLQDLLYSKMVNKGFTHTQIDNIKGILGCEINTYLEKYFFRDLADHLNLFKHLPKTPFIWHLSSGENQGFEAFISIYKWSRDKLFRLRSVYIEKRESSLKNRLSDLAEDISLTVQKEKDLITKQLREIDIFKKKIDEILQSGYDPILDDGVGKNIAPLQKKGLLKYDVLKNTELQKYLEADW